MCLILMSYISFPSSFLKLPIVLVDGAIVLSGLTAFLYHAGLAKVKLDQDRTFWFTTRFNKEHQCI